MPSRALDFLTAPRTRLILAWVALLAAAGHRVGAAWVNFRHADRANGNDGHTSIDFGGQWLMGRLLVLGYGRELYSRSKHLEVARASFPHDREPPNATEHDAERLVGWYVGDETDPVGGPLYPPIHAFVMAPIALISDPYIAYRVTQGLMLGFVGLAGLGVRYLTGGRWWWTMATALLLMFPGCRGSIALAQNSALTIAILIWGWALAVRGRPVWGGVLWGMLAFKPVWAVSFLVALLLLRQWRAAAAMAATGAGLVLLTIPIVGAQAWRDWLHVGQLAADVYNVDRNWIFLSRDLFGIPRRMLLEFRDGRAVEDRPIAAVAGWALWLTVTGTTVLVSQICLRREAVSRPALIGPLPAFVFLAAWLCSYRFMYYDSLIAPLAIVVLMADPRPYFRRAWWPFASWASILVALLLVIENATAPLNVELSASVMGLRRPVTGSDGATHQTAPTIYLASGDYYPWDTVVVLALWLWCAFQRPINKVVGEPGSV
ncbi:MAG TPA: glycosyltransferase family 87 protein [Gemmataceae bacterium]|nr:glycosyltransferase family 87 protein [Gemmataceae bacterium]